MEFYRHYTEISWLNILLFLLTILAYGRLFQKAGRSWWLVLFPIVNLLTFYDIIKRKRYILYYTICYLVLIVVCVKFTTVDIALNSLKNFDIWLLPENIDLVWSIAFLVSLVLGGIILPILTQWNLGKVYQKSGLFRLGMIIFPPLFLLILGFGSSEYQKQ